MRRTLTLPVDRKGADPQRCRSQPAMDRLGFARRASGHVSISNPGMNKAGRMAGPGKVAVASRCPSARSPEDAMGMGGDVPLFDEASTRLGLERVDAVATSAAAHLSSRIRRW